MQINFIPSLIGSDDEVMAAKHNCNYKKRRVRGTAAAVESRVEENGATY